MLEPAALTFDEIQVGHDVSFEADITEELVERFAVLSGDRNPLHMDTAYAESTRFGARIAHGFAAASFFSTLVGMHLPGKHALYLSQTLNFRAPIRIGARIQVRGIVAQKTLAAHSISLTTSITDTDTGALLIDGSALVQVLA